MHFAFQYSQIQIVIYQSAPSPLFLTEEDVVCRSSQEHSGIVSKIHCCKTVVVLDNGVLCFVAVIEDSVECLEKL